MSLIITKGQDFVGHYTVTGIEQATDWAGTASLYAAYPGTALFTKTLAFLPVEQLLEVSIPLADTVNIAAGMYQLLATITSASLGITVNKLDYVTLLAAGSVTAEPMTLLTMTLIKSDGTPAGKETRELTSTADGTTVVFGWDGVEVRVSNPLADAMSGAIVGTETTSVKTDPTGYAQIAVLKGLTVTVSCPYFGKTVMVDTTGLDTIDLSSYF